MWRTDRQTDRETDWTIHRAAWSQLKIYRYQGFTRPLSNHLVVSRDTIFTHNEMRCSTSDGQGNNITINSSQNGRRFADVIFKFIFVYENFLISKKMSLKFVPMGPINSIPALVQILAWRRPGEKTLSEPMIVRSPTDSDSASTR